VHFTFKHWPGRWNTTNGCELQGNYYDWLPELERPEQLSLFG